jgi:hypothetical protein
MYTKINNTIKNLDFAAVRKTLFYFLIFILPLNLGKTFLVNFGYIDGVLVDYFMPRVFLQDIVVLLVLLVWLYEISFQKSELLKYPAFFNFLLLFIAGLFFNVLFSTNFYISVVYFMRFVLYLLFLFHLTQESYSLSRILSIFKFHIVFLFVLSFFQWNLQSSVFDNYLILGEQPYSYSTIGVSKQSLFGYTRIPSYGLFRHPNVLAGFVLVLYFFILYFEKNLKKSLLYLYLASLTIFFTLSLSAFLAFVLGLILFYIKKDIYKFLLFLGLALFALLNIQLLPVFDDSFVIRRFLNIAAIENIFTNFFLGTGLNTSILNIDYFSLGLPYKFFQPVHNIYLLVFSELGVFLFGMVLFFIYITLKKTTEEFFNILLLIMFLGIFDHYFFTIHQTSYLMLLTLGMAFTYNKYVNA